MARQTPVDRADARRRVAWGGVRVRATTGAVAVVGLALVAASVVLLVVVRRAQVDEARSNATLRAADLVEALQSGTPPQDLPLEEGEDRFTQVVRNGRVLATSESAEAFGPLDGRTGTELVLPIGDADDRWLVVTAPAGDDRTVVVGREFDRAQESIAAAAIALALGVPALLVVVGAVTWRVVGRSLAPVDAIRREVDELSLADLARRVPEPAAGDEIADLARTMNRMLDRLEHAQLRQRRFVSDASHELRSPLAAIRQHAEVARDHPEATSPEALREVVLAEGARMERLVDDLLLLARADEGALGGRRREVDLDDLALEETHRLRSATSLRVDSSGIAPARMRGDEAMLRRAVRNVVDNAARHARSTVRVSVSNGHGRATLAVDDDGPGIAVADRERVLERFVRLDDARGRDAGGSGLGFAIVDEVVRSHGGTVTVDASDLGGLRVSLELPADADRAGPT